MENLLAFLAIRAFTHNNSEAILLYDALFSDDVVEQPQPVAKPIEQPKPIAKPIQQPKPVAKPIQHPKPMKDFIGSVSKPNVEVRKVPTKKDELMEALAYLKSKKVKTKDDKNSINILESVLRNMV